MINHIYTAASADCRSKIKFTKDDNAPFFEIDVYEENDHISSIAIDAISIEELIKYLQLILAQHNG